MTNLLTGKLIELSAKIMYQSYNAIAVEDAFEMAVGEAEVEFDTDIDMKLTDDIKQAIQSSMQAA